MRPNHCLTCSLACLIFQSTHPTRECDCGWLKALSLPEIISIHAPYKRVRPKYRKQVTAEAIISIHAPYKRVRPTSLIRRTGSLNFNPRTLQESATLRRGSTWPTRTISIHAPYKRVRLVAFFVWFHTSSSHFNPRTLQESATELTLQNFKALPISIHAPYKRVRLIDKSILNGL